jgi:hypothetical protein
MARKMAGVRAASAARRGGQKTASSTGSKPARGATKRVKAAARPGKGARKAVGRAAPAARGEADDAALSPVECETLKRHVEAEIDAFLGEMGFTDIKARTDEDGGRRFEMGRARGTAFAMIEDDDVIYHVFAPVMDVPAHNRQAAPLMRELLGINAVLSGSVRLGILGDTVYAMATKSAQLMDDEDYGEFIHEVAVVGDIAIKELRKKYKNKK